MDKKEESKEIVKQLSKHDKLRHLLFRHSNKKSKKGYSFKIVYLSIFAIFVFLTVLELPEILTILSGAKVTIPVLSTIEFKDKLNIWLTFDITVFTLVGSYSTYMQVVLGQEKGKLDDVRNELEKLYGPIYSVLNKVVYAEERKGVLTQSEKEMMDETFSREPFMLTSQEEWKLKIRNQKTTDIDMKFVEGFNKEYESKKGKEAIEKQFSPIYSMFKNVSQNVETIGILLPYEKTMIDKKFSTYPFMLNQELYDFWNKDIRPLELTIGYKAFEHRITLCENLRIDQNEVPNIQGVYLIPKAFILKFLEAYHSKVYEYRKL